MESGTVQWTIGTASNLIWPVTCLSNVPTVGMKRDAGKPSVTRRVFRSVEGATIWKLAVSRTTKPTSSVVHEAHSWSVSILRKKCMLLQRLSVDTGPSFPLEWDCTARPLEPPTCTLFVLVFSNFEQCLLYVHQIVLGDRNHV